MAELRSIVIEIKSKKSDEGNNQAKAQDPNKALAKELSTILHPINSIKEQVLGKSVLLNQAYEVAKKAIVSSVNATFQRYFTMSEDYLGENTYRVITSSISKVTSAGTAVAGGAIIGAQLGTAGAGVGAAIALAGVGINEVVQYNQKMSSYYQSLNATRYSTQYSRTRAGLVNDSRGTEN